jgi:hypothetical protein
MSDREMTSRGNRLAASRDQFVKTRLADNQHVLSRNSFLQLKKTPLERQPARGGYNTPTPFVIVESVSRLNAVGARLV